MQLWFHRDTVNPVGVIPCRRPFTTSNTVIKTFRHAVSLDEHRAKFKANLWNCPTEQEAKLGYTNAVSPTTRAQTASTSHAQTAEYSEDGEHMDKDGRNH
jgi:uncharacterized protein (DUF2235 family)